MSEQRGTRFVDLLETGWQQGKTICVGLEGDPARLPGHLQPLDPAKAVVELHRELIEATADRALAYKPQIAGFEAMGPDGVIALIETVDLVHELAPGAPVILDAKRADIGSTNDRYVDAIFGVYDADAVTVHPYLGPEAMRPFLDRADKGVIVLCRTSNPGAGHYQDLLVDGRPLYQHIAADVASTWNVNGNCGLVVGATYPDELRQVREIVGEMPILIPGIGAQGGDLEATVRSGGDARGHGMIISVSRSLIYAYEKHVDVDLREATRREMEALDREIAAARTGAS